MEKCIKDKIIRSTKIYLNREQKNSLNSNSKNFFQRISVIGGIKGENETFYIIRRNGNNVGLFSMLLTTIMDIKYAYEKGYEPVIDMKNYPNLYSDMDDCKGTDNSWELFFEQPSGYTIEQAYEGKNLILSDYYKKEVPTIKPDEYFNPDNEQIMNLKQIWSTFGIKESLVEEYDKQFKALTNGVGGVLGILVRGTDYVELKPKDHPIPPTVEDIFTDIDSLTKIYSINKIFVATEDKKLAEKIQLRYPNLYICNQNHLVSYKGGRIGKAINKQNNSFERYSATKEYIGAIYMLAQCDYLLCANTSATIGIAMMNKGYQYAKVYDLGVY